MTYNFTWWRDGNPRSTTIETANERDAWLVFRSSYPNVEAIIEQVAGDKQELVSELRDALARVSELRDALARVSDNVLGLPCFCDTPAAHSDDCVAVRQLLTKLEFECR